MQKRFFLLSFVLIPFLLVAAPVKKQVADWMEASAQLKHEIVQEMQEVKMPISSKVINKLGRKETIVADLTDQTLLELTTNMIAGNPRFVTMVWDNARLTRKDGSVVYLTDLPKNSVLTNVRPYLFNKHIARDLPTKFGKDTKHALCMQPSASIVYRLNGEYVKFEAEVGLPTNSGRGSVQFEICNVLPKKQCDALRVKYSDELVIWESHITSPIDWMKSIDASCEATAIASMLKGMDGAEMLQSELGKVKAMENGKAKYKAMLQLFERVYAAKVLNDELVWLNLPAIELAYNDMKQDQAYDAAANAVKLAELKALVAKGFDGVIGGDAQAVADAHKALQLKKDILFANPVLAPNKIVVSHFTLGAKARKAEAPDLGTQRNNWTNQESARRAGFDAAIVELSDWNTELKKHVVYKPKNSTAISDLKLHWDGDRVMFSAVQAEDNRWNIWEARLDGSSVKKMVEIPEEDIEFYDGTYLPDGRMIAISNIGYQGVPCINGSGPVGNMVLCDLKKESFRRITFDQDANWGPTVMHNGKIMYTRWEYTDLMHYYSRFVMNMNPDGTEQKALSGSGSAFPNATFDIQPVPGYSSAFVATVSGHHGVARSGRMMIFDPTKARSGVEGVLHEFPKRSQPIDGTVKDRLVDETWPRFVKPMPIDDKYYLVSAKLTPNALWGIYLVDVFDNITCIAMSEGEGYISPIMVRKSKTPPAIPDRVDLKKKDATVFIQDIYEGEGLRGVPRGSVKELRLHSYEYAYLHAPSNHDAHGIQSGWDIKRLLGTVPVEEDGSVIFTVPANTPISIQPVDAHGGTLQWMRSWMTAQPGETVSCVGCHEDQNEIPVPKRVIASQRAPHAIKAPEGGVHSISFDLTVQPVLDRACIACHNGEQAFDLRGGKKDKLGYGTSYLNLHPFIHRQGSEADMKVLQPYEYYANTSELIRLLKKGHFNVQLTDDEYRKLYNWIDYNAPDNAHFNHTKPTMTPYKGLNQYDRRIELQNKYANGMSVDYKKEMADYAAYLKAQGPIKTEMPAKPKASRIKEVKVKGWPMTVTAKPETKVVELGEGVNMTFVKVPAGEFVMGSNTAGAMDNKPAVKGVVRDAFWMGEVEVTNEQFGVFFPEHDSRYVDQQWKDHIHDGYPANMPSQPVIRISYMQAMEFCRVLSEKTGLKVTLPTETQWEWAARAGSDSDFWYGNMNTDFGKKDNFADKQTLKMAVTGVDPQPMAANNPWYEYHTYLPKEESVDDGAMLQVDAKTYQANPFGLYCMHGNICEWTKSDYVQYGSSAKNPVCFNCKEKKSECTCGQKVARGGSYIERPKFGASYARKGFFPHQRVFNVGFRVIIEE